MPKLVLRILLCAAFAFCFLGSEVMGQCMYYPVSLEQRAAHASSIVLGRVVDSHCYPALNGSIYTLNIFEVSAYLKNNTGHSRIGIVTEGGVLGDRATIFYPSVQLDDYNEYILFLEPEGNALIDEAYKAAHPELIQTQPYAHGQGALTYQFGIYHDLLVEPPRNEAETFARITALTGETATTPTGEPFAARVYEPEFGNKLMPITGFSPSPTNSGTIVPADFITITGSGFGAAAGTVFYTNADDGGATFTSSGVATDNTAWADASITNKPARRAGTGPINVNGAMTSGSSLTINYSHLEINSTFNGFGSPTRQRYYHRNLNGAGGVYFLYNTTSGMSANAPAVAAVERAMQTWRCNTFINWFSNGTTAAGLSGVDGVNVILFDGTLAAGVLGQAVYNFSSTPNAGCTLANTVWWVTDMDLRMQTDPPTAGFPWEYGPAAPAFAEFDFESVVLHELGHAHGLGHRIAAGQCMNFAISNGTSARTLNVNEINGGAARMAYSSVATCHNPPGSGTPMTLLNSTTCLLPVVLVNLNGRNTPSGNLLSWVTASEISNRGFHIQRSFSGSSFHNIGFVQGNGNSTSFTDYSFLDEQGAQYPVAYYRLVQEDLNGLQMASNVIQITNLNAGLPLSIFPSVTSDGFTVVGLELQTAPVNLSLFSADGRQLLAATLDAAHPNVDLGALAGGVYLVRLATEGLNISYQVVKQ